MDFVLIAASSRSCLVVILLTIFAHLMLLERKFLGYFQLRLGPNRTGPWGFGQPIADAVKMIIKEDIIPLEADRTTYKLAPVASLFVALAAYRGDPRSAAHRDLWSARSSFRSSIPTQGCSCCWRPPRWACTASPWADGPRRASTRSWARCVRRRR